MSNSGAQRPRGILFDAGGTLVLQDPVELARLLGHPVDPVVAFEAHYRSMDAFARLRVGGEAASWTWWQTHFFTGLGLTDPEMGAQLTNNGYGLWSAAIEGTIATVTSLGELGIKLAVVSNSDGSVRQSLSRAGFDGLFEFVLDSHELGLVKPDPAIFAHALGRLGVPAQRAWYVGDSLYHDVGGGRAAGLGASVLIDPLGLAVDYSPRLASITGLLDLVNNFV
ncbi:MAG: HAD family hydrolase [Acidimicrobiia bacterium]